MPQPSKLEQAVLDRILYIGNEIPPSLMDDPRPKFILLGIPAEFIKEVDDAEVS